MKGWTLRVAGATAVLVAAATVYPAGSQGSPGNPIPQDQLTRSRPPQWVPGTFAPSGPVLDNFELLGHNDLGQDVDYGDLYGHGDHAYVGTRCGANLRGGRGVKVVDISDPTNPTLVSRLANPRFTRAEDVVVRDVNTPTFSGTLAVAGLQLCFGSGHGNAPTGLKFFDVTDPAHPRPTGEWFLPPHTVGCHEIDLQQRPDGRVLAGCALNLNDHVAGLPGVRLVDATDPRSPVQVGEWTLGIDTFVGKGCLPFSWAHSVRFAHAGNSLWVSNWDAGSIHLDVSDPSTPTVLSRTRTLPLDEDGDNHSMTLAHDGEWLVVNVEDLSPGFCPGDSRLDGWGETFVFDDANSSSPTLLGTFATPNTYSDRADGWFTGHNTEVVGDDFYSSWYSDGIVWWTMGEDGTSTQLGQFVPPSHPQGPPLVWGVYPDRANDLILASDILSGLWIVRPIRG
jgi:hypothetical protein